MEEDEAQEATPETPLEIVSEITILNESLKYFRSRLNDPDVDTAMDLVIRLIAKPGVEVAKAPALINQLEALSAKFGIAAAYYKYMGRPKAGTPEAERKQGYIVLSDLLHRLADAVKYTAKMGF